MEFALLEELPSDEQQGEQRQVDVGDNKVGSVEVTRGEDLPAIEDDDDNTPEQTVVGGVWLKLAPVQELGPVDPLSVATLLEADIRERDGSPGDETSKRGQIRQPIQSSRSTSRQRHVRQRDEDDAEGESGDRETVLQGLSKDLGRLTSEGKTVKLSGGLVETGVTSGEGRGKHTSVDDGR